VTWADVAANDNGQASTVSGCQLSCFSSKQLRTICSRLAIKGIKNIKKSKMIDKIVATYRSRQVYNKITRQQNAGNDNNASTSTTPKPQKEVQCSFRIINILFSDTVAANFATLGNIVDRNSLDSGRAGNDEIFWVGVHCSFVQPDPVDFDNLRFLDDDVFAGQDHIDLGKIVQHDWKMLRMIWKGVNADYKAALTGFTQSGTHEQNFWDYCYGKMDIYYLRKNLEARPQLNDTVEADLPLECALPSDQGIHLDIALRRHPPLFHCCPQTLPPTQLVSHPPTSQQQHKRGETQRKIK
jgi:hypothetical protein